MKKRIFNYLTAICFLLLLAGFYAFSIYPAGSSAKLFLIEFFKGQEVSTADIEASYTKRMPARQFFISLNGGFQRLMDVRYVNEIAKLDNGHIIYLIPDNDVAPLAEKTADFGDSVKAMGIPFLYVNAPFKIDMYDKKLPAGLEDYSNENADRFLAVLRDRGIDVLDLRDSMREQGIDHYASFFSTDHHWTPETGLWAATQLVERLSSIDSSFAVDEKISKLDNYDIEVYEDKLLGSSGERTGPLYAGRDDFPIITPKFETDLHFYAPVEGIERSGSYKDTLIFEEHLASDDPFYPLTYISYCGNDYALLELSNRSAIQNLEVKSTAKRIVLIKDSFSEVVIPFLALSYDEVLCLDLRAMHCDILPIVAEFEPDAVLILYNPGAYVDNDNMFDFVISTEN